MLHLKFPFPTRVKSLGQQPVLDVQATAVKGRTFPDSIKDICDRNNKRENYIFN